MRYIKESFDNMPIAVCFFDKRGVIRLINHKMLSISDELYDGGIQTLPELKEALEKPKKAVLFEWNIPLYRFSDGTILKFEETTVKDEYGDTYTQITAVDVTALIEQQERLKKENEELSEVNAAARRLYENMAEIVRDEEILAMKMRVHDDIGHSIIVAKKTLTDNNDIDTVKEIATAWENSIELLYHSNAESEDTDDLEYALKRAEALGVKIIIDGTFPEQKMMHHLFSLAIRECVNNCVKHANGNEVYVLVQHTEKDCTLQITNNGKLPSHRIIEGGGLSALRKRFESSGGRMTVEAFPRFALTVSLREVKK